jgi:hypothetical protein
MDSARQIAISKKMLKDSAKGVEQSFSKTNLMFGPKSDG